MEKSVYVVMVLERKEEYCYQYGHSEVVEEFWTQCVFDTELKAKSYCDRKNKHQRDKDSFSKDGVRSYRYKECIVR